jgi:hypothetical protein
VAVLAGLTALDLGSGVRLVIVAGWAVIFLASLLPSAMKCRERKVADRPEAMAVADAWPTVEAQSGGVPWVWIEPEQRRLH